MNGARLLPWLVPGLCVLLAACDPFTEARPMMDEYLERLGRVLDTPAVSLAAPLPAASPLPRRRDRIRELPELDMGVLDFLSLYGCELQFVVGEKNSVMGRVMQPINRLRYEIRFIKTGEDCLPEVEEASVQDVLEAAIASKRDSLPLAVWNATWGTREIEQLFTLTKGYYPVAAEGNPVSDLVLDLEHLNVVVEKLLRGDLSADLQGLGAIHQRWQAEYRAGQIINSARLLIAALDAGTEIIAGRLSDRPLCLNGKPNNQSSIVRNFFFNIYIGRVQPWMSDVSRARDSLIAGFARLGELQEDVMDNGFRGWYQRHLSADAPGSLWRQLDEAIQRHTEHWQELLGQCGLRPGV
ncbi:DUF3080 domain-containing protein [Marinobacter sp.]|uniref:DUF3080 domain-containing protein n=1 Tax=Marinobacter sp. TaxID=50741 RepID=UPI0019AC47F6|nr:DUF3080 domain-containing protein [Marinobacter sp.]MBC7192453.1 DUF3080 domain-containing protein [Marinobacter sp.]